MIYRVEKVTEEGDSLGYEYFKTMKGVETFAKNQRERPRIECAATPRNKQEVLSLLNRWGSHPDNG